MEARDRYAFSVVLIHNVAFLTLCDGKLALIFMPIIAVVTKLMFCHTSLVLVWHVEFGAGIDAGEIEKNFTGVANGAMADVVGIVAFLAAIWTINTY